MDINKLDFAESLLSGLSEEERAAVLSILNEYAQDGKSKQFEDILYSEYSEVPVDIETFLTDDRYVGIAWKDKRGVSKLYPYWLDVLKKLFPNNTETAYDTLLESGARGLGKSEIACGAVCAYLMYRVMCLKDPVEFFHLKPGEKIAFAFMNIKLELSEAIANDKFQRTIQMSPWFMSKGTMTKRDNKPYWIPPDPIEIIIGSQADDVIGRPIYFCLDGETQIKTLDGIHKIKDLVDKNIQVISIDENGNECISETCTVKPTLETNEEYQIELEDGSIIKCTPTHRFMLKDGSYKMAKDLTEDDELFSEDTIPFGYIYKFVNLKTNKIYIGKREKPVFDEHYYGSGKLWKQDLEKYGKENIKREILCFGYSRSELNKLEKYYIKLYNSQDKNIGYNIHKGGQGGNSINDTEKWSEMHKGAKNGRYGKEVTKETRSKISKANKGRGLGIKNPKKGRPGVKKPDGFGEKISIALKKRTRSEAELNRLREFGKIAAEKNRGKKRSLETRQKISVALKGHRALKGEDNPMYGKGYKISGGNNDNAKYIYTYKNVDYQCRDDLMKELKKEFPDISKSTIRKIMKGDYTERISLKFQYVIDNLTWRLKDKYENKINQ